MADQGRWFKLWVTAPHDPALSNLSLENFARWCLFGTYLKVHGHSGMITLAPPATALQHLLRVDAYEALITTLTSFPNCVVRETASGETLAHRFTSDAVTVEWRNWLKYQEDFTLDRLHRFRAYQQKVKRSKKRREEKRREKMRKDETKPPLRDTVPPQAFAEFWTAYPKKIGKGKALKVWLKLKPSADLVATILTKVIEAKQSEQWTCEGGRFIPHPTSWLNSQGWEDDYTTEVSAVRYGRASG